MAWAARSRLRPFVRAARTIRAHLPGIIAYIRWRLTNGLVEGLNAKARMIVRRAYGYHSAHALIAMLFLTCGGVQLNPALPLPTPC
jgi:transposase